MISFPSNLKEKTSSAWSSMHATRACRRASLPVLAAAASSSFRSRPTSYNLIHHLARRSPPGPSGPFSHPSHRNLSISAPRRAQYTRFDDGPSRPPPPSAGFQNRDIIIYTLGAGSIVYYFFQCVITYILVSRLLLNVWSLLASNKSPRRVGGASWT